MLGRVWLAIATVCCGRVNFDELADAPDAAPLVTSRLALGAYYSCALIAGTPWCWGRGDFGQLGDGSFASRGTPAPVSSITDAVAIEASPDWADGATDSFTTCVLHATRTISCWGLNANGQVGDGSTANQASPQRVPLNDVVQVSVGSAHTCARTGGGTVYCWGDSSVGQLGSAVSGNVLVPTPVAGVEAIDLDAGRLNTCAVRRAGDVVCWGANTYGQLGDGSFMGSSTPVATGLLALAVEVHDEDACARHDNGDVSCWGNGFYGKLGNAMTVDSPVPVAVVGSPAAIALSSGHGVACALRATGDVVCWGTDFSGECGAGAAMPAGRSTPVQVVTITDAIAIAVGHHHSCAYTSSRGIVCWGENGNGQVGDGGTATQLVPVPVIGLP